MPSNTSLVFDISILILCKSLRPLGDGNKIHFYINEIESMYLDVIGRNLLKKLYHEQNIILAQFMT